MDDSNASHASRDIKVSPDDAGTRLDLFCAAHLPHLSRSQIHKCIQQNTILVNRTPSTNNHRVKAGETVQISEAAQKSAERPTLLPEDIAVNIIYEDEYFLAVNKPAGLVVHPGNGNPGGTLVNALLYHTKKLSDGSQADRPGIIHRLDKDTSGLLLVAKTNEAHHKFSDLFMTRAIEKTYLGICIGSHPQQHDTIEAPLGRSSIDPLRRVVRNDGKEAITEYWLLHHECGLSVVKFGLHTGRTHQIRVHCAYKGFPILGDELYGGGRENIDRILPLERPFVFKVLKSIERQALHACRIAFVHPFTGQEISLSAPIPPDLTSALSFFSTEICV